MTTLSIHYILTHPGGHSQAQVHAVHSGRSNCNMYNVQYIIEVEQICNDIFPAAVGNNTSSF